MRLSPVIFKLRQSKTRYGDYIFGIGDISVIDKQQFEQDIAFVYQQSEVASNNTDDNSINQVITDTFSVVVMVRNDTSYKEKTGVVAYDELYEIRSEIFKSILGWQIPGHESLISFVDGRIFDYNPVWLLYQYSFNTTYRINEIDDGIGDNTGDLDDFDTLYSQWLLSPNEHLPITKIPLTDIKADMTSIIDFTKNPLAGSFNRGFTSGFKIPRENK